MSFGNDDSRPAMERSLTSDQLEAFEKEFTARPANRLMQNAVTQTPVDDIALDRRILTGIDHSVSHHLDDWKVTNQKQSGRCWMFAGLNLLRVGAARKLGVKDFEFSQNYLLWWDKFERANHFLEAVIDTSGRDVDDRTVAHLLADPIGDGGQWNMFVALVAKHGLVPKSAMPETDSSSSTRAMNRSLKTLLRQGARDLRALAADGADAQRERKREVLAAVHRVLGIHLGTPPRRFLWQWEDKDKEFHRDGWLTPAEFAASYVQLPLDEYVCLVHDPRESSPFGRTFTVEYLGNVVDAPPVVYLNVPMEQLKQLTMDTIVGGEPVWFGCDVAKMMRADAGVWDAGLFDYAAVYDAPFTMDKADRLLHHDTQMTHAMLFTGVDVVDGSPRRWRVENSWGEEKADKGFWTMNDSWFGEHVFEIAVRRSALPADLATALEQPPIVLPAWDPMGALAD
ncbi:C1 family peptidase [Streptomyces sp. 5-8]|uniref:Aminopeptidase n=1 Tax=Streptomyces musisoli TaxID=2802280 RepID=A0ABS1P3A6_9ACTN|nr:MULTISPECIES: C1 family peptidase [Streptomyces]MBL1106827.1 C1 family peptidase [Streptomyces musisoli]MBY8842189.1 C1 family peptidase [Streptomyces sp. SP2-10]